MWIYLIPCFLGFGWLVGGNYSGTSGGISTTKSGWVTIPRTGWEYSNDGWKRDDDTLEVVEGAPEYPDKITIESDGPAATAQQERMGIYKIQNRVMKFGRAVYEHLAFNEFLFFDGEF